MALISSFCTVDGPDHCGVAERASNRTEHKDNSTAANGGPRLLSQVRRVRLLSGMSQAETAALAGISRHALSNLETGLSQPQLRTALALCRALGQTDPRVLFPGLDVADG
jgi:DNA-binding XRE family transcriptional regulator